jgi:hypothetical protein
MVAQLSSKHEVLSSSVTEKINLKRKEKKIEFPYYPKSLVLHINPKEMKSTHLKTSPFPY